MSREVENLWQPIHSLWTKFCGVSDEYRMLRDKWLLARERLGPALADLGTEYRTFNVLDQCLEGLDEEFLKFGLRRDRRTSFQIQEIVGNLDDLHTIKSDLFSLSQYTGLLKLAYFQRTESMEISSVTTGEPHGAERTIGNELFYVAADKITSRYKECLNIEFVEWDGFVTFLSPITTNFFYGALFKATESFKLFHVSMSEEQKYFVGSYLHLAHELGHACISGKEIQARVNGAISSEIDGIFALVMNYSLQEEWGGLNRCEYCPFNRWLMYKYKDKRSFEEFLADLIALEVGGIYTLEAFVDEFFNKLDHYRLFPKNGNENEWMISVIPSLENILRTRSTLFYLELQGRYNEFRREIEFRISNLIEKSAEVIEGIIDENVELLGLKSMGQLRKRDVCIECVSSLGRAWTKKIIDIDGELIRRFVSSPFNIDTSTETEISDNLKRGIPCLNHDVRHILHVYYQLFRGFHRTDQTPNNSKKASYAATIHSLVAENEH